MSWISVNDRMPEECTSVLVCDAYRVCADEREPHIAYFDKGDWVSLAWWDYSQYAFPKVTHWMPLPKPPSKEDM